MWNDILERNKADKASGKVALFLQGTTSLAAIYCTLIHAQFSVAPRKDVMLPHG